MQRENNAQQTCPCPAQTCSRSCTYLTCERNWVYDLLIAVAGILGAYTFLECGNVFCNAQTANLVLLGISWGAGNWMDGTYYIIPICAYLLGSFLSELLPKPIRKILPVRWDTLLIGTEIAAVAFIAMLPASAPVQISQVTVNFIASMQYNTFRRSEGIPVATTFATNHIRQIGVGLAKSIQHRHKEDHSHVRLLRRHALMLLFFVLGTIVGTIGCKLFERLGILLALVPLAVVLAAFLHADLRSERDLLDRKPGGH